MTKPQQVHCVYLMVCQKVLQHDKNCTLLEKRHREKENDSIYVTLESATLRIELYTPEQWFAAVRGACTSKQRYRVKEMLAEDFYDFKAMLSSAKNMSTDDNRKRIM